MLCSVFEFIPVNSSNHVYVIFLLVQGLAHSSTCSSDPATGST